MACGAPTPRILSLDDYFLQETTKQEEDPETGKKIQVKVTCYFSIENNSLFACVPYERLNWRVRKKVSFKVILNETGFVCFRGQSTFTKLNWKTVIVKVCSNLSTKHWMMVSFLWLFWIVFTTKLIILIIFGAWLNRKGLR